MRICSFLPSATDILYELGLADSVVGVTYECDPPPGRTTRPPVVVHSRLPHCQSSAEIDRQVRDFLARGESLYRVDAELLARLEPDLILTQDLCRVCAASPGDLPAALDALPRKPRTVTLTPRTLGDVWLDIRRVGEATGRGAQAEAVVAALEERVEHVERAVAGCEPPRVVCLEWLDPPYIGGHWVPEMVARAGGQDVLGRASEPSFRTDWESILGAQPEAVVVLPCGYNLKEAINDFQALRKPPGWNGLPAVRTSRVFAVDADRYFARPGPQLAAGVEILAEILHPQRIQADLPLGSHARLL